MVEYTVDLEIDEAIHEEYLAWLGDHIRTMLTFRGFDSAVLSESLSDSPATGKRTFTVRYLIESESDLEAYLANQATEMRRESAEKFPGRFTATRRIDRVRTTFGGASPNGAGDSPSVSQEGNIS